MKIVGMAQIHNELETGHLHRCLDHYRRLCDEIVILDDASTDGSEKAAREYTSHLIRNEENNWAKDLETLNKARLLERTMSLNPDWIVSFDADELYERRLLDRSFLENLLAWATSRELRSLCFNWNHLWLSETWYRADKHLSTVSPPRIWRNLGNLQIEVLPGLHRRLWPAAMDNPTYVNLAIVHYSSSSEAKLKRKILNYARLDSTRDYLSVLDGVSLAEVDYDWFEDAQRPARQPHPDLERAHARIRSAVNAALEGKRHAAQSVVEATT